jgi:hypothetical protein
LGCASLRTSATMSGFDALLSKTAGVNGEGQLDRPTLAT